MGNVQSVRKEKPLSIPLIVQAASDGRRDLVNLFLKHDDTIHIDTSCHKGVTSLIAASFYGHYDVVKFLLDKRANVNAQCSDGTTALMAATVSQRRNIVALLLSHDAQVTIQRHTDGVTALMSASDSGDAQIAELILNVDKSNIDEQNKWKQTALIIAVRFHHIEMAKVLLRHGASPEVKDYRSRTALMYASMDPPHIQIINLLIQHINPDSRPHYRQINPSLCETNGEITCETERKVSTATSSENDSETFTKEHAASTEANLSDIQLHINFEAATTESSESRIQSAAFIPETVQQFNVTQSSNNSQMGDVEMCGCDQCVNEINKSCFDPRHSPTNIYSREETEKATTALQAKISEQHEEIDKLQTELDYVRAELHQTTVDYQQVCARYKEAISSQRQKDDKNRQLEETIGRLRQRYDVLEQRLARNAKSLEISKQWNREQLIEMSHTYDKERKTNNTKYKELEEECHELETELDNKDKEIQKLQRQIDLMKAEYRNEDWEFITNQRRNEAAKTSGYSSQHGSTLSLQASSSAPNLPPTRVNSPIHINVNLHAAESNYPTVSVQATSPQSCPIRCNEPMTTDNKYHVLTDSFLFDFSERVTTDVWQLAPLLGVNRHALTTLRDDNPYNLKRLIYQMFNKWKDSSQKSEQYMLVELHSALKQIKRWDLVNELQPHIDQ